mgnify:CR=1 FL=1
MTSGSLGTYLSKTNYSYTEEDVKKIYSVLKMALDEMKVRFEIKASEEKKSLNYKQYNTLKYAGTRLGFSQN